MDEKERVVATETKRQVVRIGGLLREVVEVYDKSGRLLHKVVSPLMLDFRPRDVLQVLVGSTLLAVPVMFTEEVWVLGSTLPTRNIIFLNVLSLIFIAAFVYFNFYRLNLVGHRLEFTKRVVSIYILSFLVVALLLTLVDGAPWKTDWLLAVKRVVIIAFPASMSAAVADMIK